MLLPTEVKKLIFSNRSKLGEIAKLLEYLRIPTKYAKKLAKELKARFDPMFVKYPHLRIIDAYMLELPGFKWRVLVNFDPTVARNPDGTPFSFDTTKLKTARVTFQRATTARHSRPRKDYTRMTTKFTPRFATHSNVRAMGSPV